MTIAILTLLGTLLSIGFYLLKRSDARKADPLEQNRQRYAQTDNDIAARDSSAASLHGNADLDELERLQNSGGGDSSRPDGNVSQGR